MRLHPKYGVNPTIPICFFCGKEQKEIILLGASYKGEAPMKTCLSKHEPCEQCQEYMEMGIILVSVRDTEDRKEQQNPYRTGGWWVVRDEFVKRIFDKKTYEDASKSRFCFITHTAAESLGLFEKGESNEKSQ